jgi:hypothetical protein
MNPLAISAAHPLRLPGLGFEAMRRLGPLVQACSGEMQSVVRDAATRWARKNGPQKFNASELGRLISAFTASTGAAELLGRSQIAIQAGEFATVDHDPPVFERFASPIPALTPLSALRYFLRLVPQLGIDPQRFGDRIERHAFTLAEATEKTVLQRVQSAIAHEMSGQRQTDPQSRGSQPLSPTERIQQALDASGISPKNPQYAEMAFRTNVMDSYHAGIDRELAQPEMQKMFPAWQYLGIRDGREGEDHRPKFGLFYPISASFNEVRGDRVWNCRCSKKAITKGAWSRLLNQGHQLESSW